MHKAHRRMSCVYANAFKTQDEGVLLKIQTVVQIHESSLSTLDQENLRYD